MRFGAPLGSLVGNGGIYEMKKALSLILALILMLSMAVTASAAPNSGTCGSNLTWTLTNGVLTISGTGDMTDFSKNTPAPWQSVRDDITKVEVRSGVTSIGSRAFAGCSNLLFAQLPASIERIGDYAFSTTSLAHCPLRDGVTTIGAYAFQYCDMGAVTIPDSVTEIGWYAFEGCNNITRVTIGSGLKSIPKYAFKECKSILFVNIKSGVEIIDHSAFSYCYDLQYLAIPRSVTQIGGSAFFTDFDLKSVYYGGSAEDWAKIGYKDNKEVHFIEAGNGEIKNAKLHYNSTMPAQIAYEATQTITVDGKRVELQAYALLDDNGYATNYFRIRDIAHILNGTNAQFAVDWDNLVKITKHTPYTPNGSELNAPFSGNQYYYVSDTATFSFWQDGEPIYISGLDSIVLLDANGGGYTYYKLRDIGKRMGFYVNWAVEDGIIIDSTRGYEEN